VFKGFQREDAGALTHDEAVAIDVERAAGVLRVVVARAHRLHRAEAGKGKWGDRSLRAAGDHDVGFAAADGVVGIAEGMRGRRAGGNHTVVRATGPQLDADHAGADVADQRGDGERGNLAGAAFAQGRVLRFKGAHAADTRTDDHAHAVGILLRHVEAGVFHGLLGGAETQMRIAVVAARLLGIHVLGGIPPTHLGADLRGEIGGVKQGHTIDAALAGHQAGPKIVHRVADRGDGTQAGDNDAAGRGSVLIHKRRGEVFEKESPSKRSVGAGRHRPRTTKRAFHP